MVPPQVENLAFENKEDFIPASAGIRAVAMRNVWKDDEQISLPARMWLLAAQLVATAALEQIDQRITSQNPHGGERNPRAAEVLSGERNPTKNTILQFAMAFVHPRAIFPILYMPFPTASIPFILEADYKWSMLSTLPPPPSSTATELPPRDLWTEAARRRRDTYAITPGAPLLKTEFGFYCWEEWKKQGMPDIEEGSPEANELFHFDNPGYLNLGELGWCEPAYIPHFEVKLLEDRGDTEVEQDWAGRGVLYFKGRRQGFMPEYITHPVKDLETWKDNAAWRLDPNDPRRYEGLAARMAAAQAAAARGEMITQQIAGSFMYLRSMLGPEELLYAFHDQPDLIETAMSCWLELADAVIATHQKYVTIDEIFFAEDNCYNHGPLISPAMIRDMLLPYYKELLRRLKARQADKSRHLYLQIDTDGDCRPLISFYMEEIGMDAMSPFEVASGCDVVEIAKQHPGLCLRGGIDKRILAAGPDAIDAMVERILPTMKKRGGYFPTCDHGVPAEVSFSSYLHYRRRCVELGE